MLFGWVYDCGTVSKQSYLKLAMNHLGLMVPPSNGGSRPTLNLVAVSHFDRGHISGLVSLLREFTVDTLLLPYMPLWQRLVLAFAEGIDSRQQVTQFFLNPARVVQALEGADVRQIVYVSGNGREPPRGQIGDAETQPGEGPWEPSFESMPPSGSDQRADAFAEEFPDFRDLKDVSGTQAVRRTCNQVFDDFVAHCESRMAKNDLAFATSRATARSWTRTGGRRSAMTSSRT